VVVAPEIVLTGPPDQNAANGNALIDALEELPALLIGPDERPLKARDSDFPLLDIPEEVREALDIRLD
jgi:hypothetical protein